MSNEYPRPLKASALEGITDSGGVDNGCHQPVERPDTAAEAQVDRMPNVCTFCPGKAATTQHQCEGTFGDQSCNDWLSGWFIDKHGPQHTQPAIALLQEAMVIIGKRYYLNELGDFVCRVNAVLTAADKGRHGT